MPVAVPTLPHQDAEETWLGEEENKLLFGYASRLPATKFVRGRVGQPPLNFGNHEAL